jgi:DNA gyrase subunit A
VLASGKVVRSAVAEVPAKGRDTMGVVFARFDDDDKIIAIARNSERNIEITADPEATVPDDTVAEDAEAVDSSEAGAAPDGENQE